MPIYLAPKILLSVVLNIKPSWYYHAGSFCSLKRYLCNFKMLSQYLHIAFVKLVIAKHKCGLSVKGNVLVDSQISFCRLTHKLSMSYICSEYNIRS